MSDQAIIEVEGLRTQFGQQVIHEDLDVAVRRGEVMGVVGGSGTGKSVLMRTIIGLTKPAAGRIRLFDIDTAGLSIRERRAIERRWGVLFQDGALFSSLTVAQNIAVPMKEHTKLSASLQRELIDIKVSLVGLPTEAAHKYPSELSGGMRKRAGLARALALDAPIVYFDEPSAGLDPIMASGLDDLILDLRRLRAITFVIVTHELESIRKIADRVVMLDRGTVTFTGTVAEAEHESSERVRQFFARKPDEYIGQRNAKV